ncbi:MAG: GspE/PulE family protein [Candidatus Brocadiia bacterium]
MNGDQYRQQELGQIFRPAVFGLVFFCLVTLVYAGELGGDVSAVLEMQGGFYIHPLWLILIPPSIFGWLLLSAWAADDALGVGMGFRKWCTIFVGTGLFGVMLTFLLHPICFLVLVLGVGGVFVYYLWLRNAVVPEQFRIGPEWLCAPESSVKGPAGGTATARVSPRVSLEDSSGRELSDWVAEKERFADAADTLENLIGEACEADAEAMRLEPGEEEFAVLFRLYGVMQKFDSLDLDYGKLVVACVAQFLGLGRKGKARAELKANIQGGESVSIQVRGRKAQHGAAVVFNMPDWTEDLYRGGLEALGMHKAMIQRIKKLVATSGRSILFSGPSRSGKTTTFHATLNEIDIFTTDVHTFESRLEHELGQIQRHQVDLKSPEKVNNTLAPVLRQEPDVLAVDEIVNTKAVVEMLNFPTDTGRFIGTIQAGGAPEATVQLVKGLDGGVAAKTLSCVVSQRLVRTLCDDCKEPVAPNPKLLEKLNIDPENAGEWFRAVGCEACLNTGFKGQTGVFEMLILNDRVHQVMQQTGVSADAVKKAAGSDALRTLYQDALLKVQEGVTTLKEIRRILKK